MRKKEVSIVAQGKKKKAVKKTAKRTVVKTTPKKTKKAAPKKVTAKKVAPKKTAPQKLVKPVTPKSNPAAKPVSFKNFLTPLDDRLLVQLSETERKTAGGLYIPDTVADVSGNLEGTVVAIGHGHRDGKGRLRPMDVKVGDNIIFSQHSGNKIEMRGENIIILREAEVMGVLNK